MKTKSDVIARPSYKARQQADGSPQKSKRHVPGLFPTISYRVILNTFEHTNNMA